MHYALNIRAWLTIMPFTVLTRAIPYNKIDTGLIYLSITQQFKDSFSNIHMLPLQGVGRGEGVCRAETHTKQFAQPNSTCTIEVNFLFVSPTGEEKGKQNSLNVICTFPTLCHSRLTVLTCTAAISIVAIASAKSEARFLNPDSQRRSSRHQSGFFCCGLLAPAVFMAGLMGPTSVGPVSF